MKNIVSFSGGRTSAYMVHLMEQKRINDGWDVEYVFCDTGAEHPKTYEFIRKCVDHFAIELTCLRAKVSKQMGIGVTYKTMDVNDIGPDLSVWSDIVSKYGTPYMPSGAFCSGMLKTIPYDKYLKEKYGKGNYQSWLGMRVDEKSRLKGKANTNYLAHISQMDKDDIIGWWVEMPFNLEIPEWLGNCVFCIKKGVNKVALAMKQEPEMAAKWNAMLKAKTVRNDRELPSDFIYRGKLSIDGIAELHLDYSEEELIDNLRRSKRAESGCGSESCEPFAQIDMFEEDAA